MIHFLSRYSCRNGTGFRFGEVEIGDTKQMTLIVSNPSTFAMVEIIGITSTDPCFTANILNGPWIAPYSNHLMRVYFTPQDTIVYEDTVTIETDCGNYEVAVYGEGVAMDRLGIKDITTDGLGLTGIYPNPFNREVKIEFEHLQAGEAELRVWNTEGRMIHQQKKMQAGGKGEFFWRPDNQASGVYFFSLMLNGQTATGKLVYMK